MRPCGDEGGRSESGVAQLTLRVADDLGIHPEVGPSSVRGNDSASLPKLIPGRASVDRSEARVLAGSEP
jgi:hypothetical protein